jgi:signal transduction histidine kinase/CheY-like chemotaxis protein
MSIKSLAAFRRASPRCSAAFGLVAGVFLWNSDCFGQTPANPEEGLPILTRSAEIYHMEGPARELRHHFRIEAIANYYDPVWNQFYGWDGTDTFYMVPPSGQRFAFKPGERVLLTGEVVPATGFRAEKLAVKVLEGPTPKEILSSSGRLEDRAALNARLIEVEGLVDWQDQIDLTHQRLSIICEGHRIDTIVWLNEAGQAPLLTGAIVRAVGLYLPQVDINNRLVTLELRVQGTENLSVLGWLDKDPRFDAPTTRIADVAQAPAGARLHVAGRIDAFAPGRSATIRDATGLLELRTPQERGLHVGAEIDAVGYRSPEGGDIRLEQVLWRQHSGAALTASDADRAVLNLAAQVLDLPAEKAVEQQPVSLSGVVTWGDETARFFFLQDRSGGVRVDVDPKSDFQTISAGLELAVTGVTAMGEYAPEVIYQHGRVGLSRSQPEPQRISLEQALTGANEAQWVEMEGYVRGVESASPWTQLDLTTATGEFRALLPPSAKVEDKIGAFVRIQGVCDVIANEFHRATGVQLWVPLDARVDVDEVPASNPFAVPFTPLENLGRFESRQRLSHLLHTAGTITYKAPGRFLVLQNGTAHLLALSRDKANVVPGDLVDIVGIPGWDGTRSLLREAVLRKTSHEPEPRARTFSSRTALSAWNDLRLVRVDGLLSEVSEFGDEYLLTIRSGSENIVARLDHSAARGIPGAWRKDSSVSATGVYRLRYDEHGTAVGGELLLRMPADLAIVRSPPWWTIERALSAAGVCGAFALVVFVWVASLRRRVRKQTAQIHTNLQDKARLEAELERAERLNSLGMMAGGIAHDFNNLLTVILGNITLAKLDEVVMARAGDCLRDAEAGSKRAQGLTLQLLTFAKGGDPVRVPLPLPAIVNSSIALALSGAKSCAEFKAPADLWLVSADEAQLGRAVQNLLANANAAVPEGAPIELGASNETVTESTAYPLAPGRYVRLTVSDHGAGIPASQLSGIFDPYSAAKLGKDQFGLATAYSIVKRHGGFIEVQSSAGNGTTMGMWIPAAEAAPQPKSKEAAPAQSPANKRILLMDDEETIRSVGMRVLKRLNYDATAVADGAECIKAYRDALAAGRPFDVVIMDLTVPGGMGGIKTVAELRQIDPRVRAIVSSGYSKDPVLANFRDYGFRAVVAKPYEVTLLAAVIEHVMNGQDDS